MYGSTAPAGGVSALATAVRPSRSRYVLVAEVLLWATMAAAVAGVGVLVWHLAATTDAAGQPRDPLEYGWALGGLFALSASILALHDIHLHLAHWVSPLQRYYVRILALIIVYAIESWCAFKFPSLRTYLGILRGLYEAFTLYSFFQLMLVFLGGRRRLARRLLANGKARTRALPWFACCRTWRNGYRFVHRCCVGVYQYVLIRAVFCLLSLVAEACGVYGEGDWSPRLMYLYATVVTSASQFYCINVLGTFYINAHALLRPLSPLAKFGIIKLLVFLLFWQGIAMSIAGFLGLVRTVWSFSNESDTSAGIQNFAICVELFAIALMMRCAYSYRDFWSPDGGAPTPIVRMLAAVEAFDAGDSEAASEGRNAKGVKGGAAQAAVRAVAGALDGGAAAGDDQAAATPAEEEDAGGGTEEGADETHLVAPAAAPVPLGRALCDILPLDVAEEGGEYLSSGFGLAHKWRKRRAAAAASATGTAPAAAAAAASTATLAGGATDATGLLAGATSGAEAAAGGRRRPLPEERRSAPAQQQYAPPQPPPPSKP